MSNLREFIEKSIKMEKLRGELVRSAIANAIYQGIKEDFGKYEEQYQGIMEELRDESMEKGLAILKRMVKSGYTYKPWTHDKVAANKLLLHRDIIQHLKNLIGEVD